jgi:hypothetical protein
LILDQDDIGAPAARALTQTEPPTEQRMPSVRDGREYRFVCGMTRGLAT